TVDAMRDGPPNVVHDGGRIREVHGHLRACLGQGLGILGQCHVDVGSADQIPEGLSTEAGIHRGHEREVRVLHDGSAYQTPHPPCGAQDPDPDHAWRPAELPKASSANGPMTASAISRPNTSWAASRAVSGVTASIRSITSSTDRISPWLISDRPTRDSRPLVSSSEST